jgi:hypothetical protein
MNKKWMIMVIVILVSCIPLFNLLTKGLPITHDGQDHVARIANFYQALQDGVIIPRWAGNLNWGYGHPILMFLYPLPSYVASLFHFIGLSFVDSTKTIFAIFFVMSVLFMYIYASRRFGRLPGIVAAVLFGFAPYRFVDLYVRGALGEHAAFMFLPLILYFIDRLSIINYSTYTVDLKKQYLKLKNQHINKKVSSLFNYFSILFRIACNNPFHGVGLSLSTAGLILSHNAISIMFIPVIGMYVWYVWKFEMKKNTYYILLTLIYILLGFGLSTFFWIPALIEGRYTLRDIVTQGEFGNRFIDWKQLFYTPWNYGGDRDLPKDIGLSQWIIVVIALWYLVKTNIKSSRLLLVFSIVFIISIIFMLPISGFIWKYVTLLQKFQFPWRFLTLLVFSTSIIGAIVMTYLHGKLKYIFAGIIIFISIIGTSYMWRAKAYKIYDESFFTGVYDSTTDTGESSPIWSIRFMEKRANKSIEIIDGTADISTVKRSSVFKSYTITVEKESRILENTLYFPGWKVLIDGKPTTIQFQDPSYRGLITFIVSEGKHNVDIKFGDTIIRKISNMISLITLICIGVLLIISKKYTYEKH